MTVAQRDLARTVQLVGPMINALDRAVRLAADRLPDDVTARWTRFHLHWRTLIDALASLDRACADVQPAELVAQVERWAEALVQWGIVDPEARVGFDGFISPSRARARMDSVNAEVGTLDEHIRARQAELGAPFVHAWSRWRDSWRSFYGGYDRAWDWWYLGNASAWNETLVFQERLGHWREAAEQAGVRFTVPRPQSAPERRPENSLLGSARDIAIAGAIGVAVLGGVYLVSKVA